jgi:hypothetical protein
VSEEQSQNDLERQGTPRGVLLTHTHTRTHTCTDDLGAALRRYLDNLLAAPAPASRHPALDFAVALDAAEAATDPAAQMWVWGRLLTDWPRWRPHRVERLLTVPPADTLLQLADRCRGAPPDGTGDAPAEAAALLTALAAAPAAVSDYVERAVGLGAAVDARLAALPANWLPAALVRAAPDWPDDPPGPAWQAWLRTPSGGDWFDTLVRAEGEDARAVRDESLRAVGVGCVPDPAADWSPGDGPIAPGVRFAAGPVGRVVAVERYSPFPESARFTVGLGPPDGPAGPVAAVWAEVSARPADAPLRVSAQVWVADILAGRPADDPDPLAGMLVALGEADPSAVASPDAVLAALRSWAVANGWAVLPADWSYAGGGAAPAAGEGLAVKAVFRRDTPAGQVVRVKRFGLVAAGRVAGAGEVVVSAGPPPHGLTDLEALAAAAPGPAAAELGAAFQGLRPAGAGGYLELAALDLYTRFWDGVRPGWEAADPAGADRFGRGLGVLMAEGFGLAGFAPANFRDHPDGWVLVPPGTRMTTGRVTRVLRPGLTAAGELRVPARVEAE